MLVTGGTGFIGAHTVRALLNAGHKVRLLIRGEAKMRQLFGNRIEEFVVGDVTDEAAVKQALLGCQGVIHCAAKVSVDPRDAPAVQETNIGGTRLVIGSAVNQGLTHIIYVSSVAALYDGSAQGLSGYSPVGRAQGAYGQSKVACEHYVRAQQAAGAPISITYPSSVIGPDDPGCGAPHQGIKTYLAGYVPVMPSGGQWIDVRDVAAAHLRLIEADMPAGRITLGGHFLPWSELADLLAELTGVSKQKIFISGGLMRLIGRAFDGLRFFRLRVALPVTREGMVYATRWVKLERHSAELDLGMHFRPVEVTLADAIASLFAAGEISSGQAGKLARAL